MQIEELFEFVYILIDKKRVTAKDMAERFGVSTRTIYRWVEALSISGIPVYSMIGRGGGIAIAEEFSLDKTVLTEEDRMAIVSSDPPAQPLVRCKENFQNRRTGKP